MPGDNNATTWEKLMWKAGVPLVVAGILFSSGQLWDLRNLMTQALEKISALEVRTSATAKTAADNAENVKVLERIQDNHSKRLDDHEARLRRLEQRQ